jgi:hypothetical protein
MGAARIASAVTLAADTAMSADFATGAAPVAPTNQWTFSLTPYGWVTWLQGDSTVRGRAVEVDVDPIELIEHLEGVPFMGYAEARKGPLAFYGDIVYANLGLDADSVRSRSQHPLIGGTLSASLGLDIKMAIVEAGGAYEVAKWPSGDGSHTAIDVLAGARYWHQDADLKLALDGNLDIGDLVVSKGIAIARSGSVDWVDPVIGARIRHQLTPGQDLLLRGDIGGFGAGSEFSWNVLAAYSFEICAQDGVTYSGVLGYRLLDVDYEQGSGRTRYEYDVLQHGPLSGLTIQF